MKRRYFLYLLWILLPLTAAARVWQLHTVVDTAGFYAGRYASLCTTIEYVLLAVFVAVILLARLGLPKGKENRLVQPPVKSIPLGIASLLLAVSCIPQVIAESRGITATGGGWIGVLLTIVLAVSFTVISACQFTGKAVPFIVVLLPVITEFCRLVTHYAHFNGIAQISENMIHILFLCAFLAFLLSHCRIYAGENANRGIGWCYGCGFAAAVLGICSSLPHLLLLDGQQLLAPIHLGGGLYALIFLWVMAFRPKASHSIPAESITEASQQAGESTT